MRIFVGFERIQLWVSLYRSEGVILLPTIGQGRCREREEQMGSSTGTTSATAGSLGYEHSRLRLKTLGMLAIVLLAGLMQALPAAADSRSATVGHLGVDGRWTTRVRD